MADKCSKSQLAHGLDVENLSLAQFLTTCAVPRVENLSLAQFLTTRSTAPRRKPENNSLNPSPQYVIMDKNNINGKTTRGITMQYRNFKDQTSVSLLGFGAMRLPQTEDGKIDRKTAKAMLDQAYAGGINYFDTAYGYHSGESESFLGEALKDYPRDSFYLADKMPMWVLKDADHAKRLFQEQLDKCQTEYFDFYLLHSATKSIYEKAKKFKTIEYLLEEKKASRIKRLGFSFHDDYALFEEIVLAYPWDFCQIQFNYMDVNYQAGEKGLKFAAAQGLDVIIMEPLKGGKLANVPDTMLAPLKAKRPDANPVEWAFAYIASYPEVKLILSGMSTLDQMAENLHLFDALVPLNQEELAAMDEAKEIFASNQRNLCTNCGYCMPCPFGVDIPNNFLTWNEYGLYGKVSETIVPYFSAEWDDARADKCTECGLCESLCPQHIQIRSDLKAMHQEFSVHNR